MPDIRLDIDVFQHRNAGAVTETHISKFDRFIDGFEIKCVFLVAYGRDTVQNLKYPLNRHERELDGIEIVTKIFDWRVKHQQG